MLHIIVNPAGASGHAGQIWKKIEPVLAAQDRPYTVHFSRPDLSIETLARQLSAGGEDTDIVVIGGDGSVNEAVNGLARFRGIRFGFVPCGSGNDLARDLAVPHDPVLTMKRILGGSIVRTIDVGEVTMHDTCDRIDPLTLKQDPSFRTEALTRRFVISAGLGFDAEICEGVLYSQTKKILNKIRAGKLSYIAVAMRLIFRNESFYLDMKTDDRTVQQHRCMFAVAMNHRYEGGGFMFCPHAVDNDGLLDYCMVHDLSTADFFRLFPSSYDGRHLEQTDRVMSGRSRTIEMRADRPLWVHTDGEIHCRSSHISVRLDKEQLAMLV
ncbi:MAG: diacylglycerol kinase family lipid kinase [Solobacterium sp.]|nr:diacylglycerol kinase family lipid kinase [Solobacterium sp.]